MQLAHKRFFLTGYKPSKVWKVWNGEFLILYLMHILINNKHSKMMSLHRWAQQHQQILKLALNYFQGGDQPWIIHRLERRVNNNNNKLLS